MKHATILSKIADLQFGVPSKAGLMDVNGRNIPLLRMSDISSTVISSINLSDKKVSAQGQIAEEKHLLQEGDILMSTKGISYQASIIGFNIGRYLVSFTSPLIRIRTKGDISPYVLLAYLNHPDTQSLLKEKSDGTSTQFITKEVIAQLKVPSLALDQQNDIEALIAKVHELEQNVVSIKQAIIHKLTKVFSPRYSDDY